MAGLKERLFFAAPVPVQNWLVSAYGRRLYRRRYGDGFEEVCADIERLERADGDANRRTVDERLAAVTRFAAEHVPHWRRVWAQRGLAPDAIRTVEDLSALPVLEKADLQRDPRSFVPDDGVDRQHVLQTTSGSTGTPLEVPVDRETYQRAMGILVHHETRVGVPFGAPRATLAGRMVQPATRMRPPFWRFNAAENQMLFSAYHLSVRTVAAYAAELERFRPQEVIGYPSAIATLATLLEESGRRLDFAPQAVVTNSETLFDWQRRTIERVLGAPVWDYYGTAEYVAFAWQDGPGSYRVHPGLGWVETEGPAEAAGDLLLTTLSNRAMPLFRYRVGDVAALLPGAFVDSNVQRLGPIQGRVDDVVIGPDGRRVGRLDHVFKDVAGLRECQIVQRGPTEFLLRVVPGEGFSTTATDRVRENLEARLGAALTVEVETVDSIPRGAQGKFRGVLNEWRPPHDEDAP